MLAATVEHARARALVVDDKVVMRYGLASLLQTSGRVVVVGQADSRTEAAHKARELEPDVVVLDLPPAARGDVDVVDMEAVTELSRVSRVLVLTAYADHDRVERALRAGATSFLVHGQFDAPQLVAGVVATAAGEPVLSATALRGLVDMVRASRSGLTRVVAAEGAWGLSRREAEIMREITHGRANGEIAHVLSLSEKTVRNHVNHIYTKLHVRSRAEAIATWLGLAARSG